MSKYTALMNDRYGIGDYLRTIGRQDLFVSAEAMDEFLALMDQADLVYEIATQKIGECDDLTLEYLGLFREEKVQKDVDAADQAGYEMGFDDALEIVADWIGNDQEITLDTLGKFEDYARGRV